MIDARRLWKLLAIAALALGCGHAAAQQHCARPPHVRLTDFTGLPVTPTSLDVEVVDGHPYVTTLATIDNAMGLCLDKVVVEIRYFDAKHQLVDTVIEPVASPVMSRELAFRARAEAARDKAAYVTQSARVVSAEPRAPTLEHEEPNVWVSLLLSWAPMLLLIGVWVVVARRTSNAKSPSGRMATASEAQLVALQAQVAALQRLVATLEAK